MSLQVNVTVSNEEQKLTEKFLVYEGLSLSHDDAALKKMVDGVVSKFEGVVDEVLVKIKYIW